ncbi:MAG: hypothetical protein AAGM22_08245 [Acidobacteriota bacterium]
MDERHENEQYFFDAATLARLRDLLGQWQAPCCICAPMVGKALVDAGRPVTILDIDERFSTLPGFRHFDLVQPEWLADRFDVILCDPPFYNVSLSKLFETLRGLAHYDFKQRLMVSFLSRRARALERSFSPFGLTSTGFFPGYKTVEASAKNRIEFFANLESSELGPLFAGA